MNHSTSGFSPSSALRDDWRDGIQLALAVLLSFAMATLPFELLYFAALGVCSIFTAEAPSALDTIFTITAWLYMLTVFPILFLRSLRGFRIGFAAAAHHHRAPNKLNVA